ncbi:DNA adenine methylase [Cryobacterium sp. W22_MBD10_FK3]|uniref:DNA adenine methylase n=1 Tax=Cryobacterium sp. W22_MBD10_FK3 TaxID=3240273 RepID=UPI003F910F7A
MSMVTVTSDRRLGRHSPLRYPGGKSKLAGFFADLIQERGLPDVTYVEPFAGGAGAGLALLQMEVVNRLVINDLDVAVYSFWQSIVTQNEQFARLIESAPLDLEEWARQKEIYRRADARDTLQLGFAFFYLNRTNRSGVLHAGVIGGKAQSGSYRIDARFNRTDLAARVRALERLSERITVTAIDGKRCFETYSEDQNAFLYVDPPYVEMGGSLYLNSFTHRDHAALAGAINRAEHGNWLLTYDDVPLIRDLYRDRDIFDFELSYSAHRVEKARELMIAAGPLASAISSRAGAREL